MSDYKRFFLKGGTYFFTVVTFKRLPIFRESKNIDLLKQCFKDTMSSHPFKIDAIVILPDHLHTVLTLPENEFDFSTRWKLIKGTFSRRFHGSDTVDISDSMRKKNEKGIWQRRFWEHYISDDEDFIRHCDYIHYNPVKHRLVNSPIEWEYSSLRKLIEEGFYPANWGNNINKELLKMNYE